MHATRNHACRCKLQEQRGTGASRCRGRTLGCRTRCPRTSQAERGCMRRPPTTACGQGSQHLCCCCGLVPIKCCSTCTRMRACIAQCTVEQTMHARTPPRADMHMHAHARTTACLMHTLMSVRSRACRQTACARSADHAHAHMHVPCALGRRHGLTSPVMMLWKAGRGRRGPQLHAQLHARCTSRGRHLQRDAARVSWLQ